MDAGFAEETLVRLSRLKFATGSPVFRMGCQSFDLRNVAVISVVAGEFSGCTRMLVLY